MARNGTVSENQITPQQQRAIACLLAAKSVADAAKSAGVPLRTLFRWLSQDAFVTALRAAERELIATAARRLVAMQSDALDRVAALIAADAAVKDEVRLRASVAVLDFAIKLRMLSDLEKRITQLETSMHEQHR